jgi:basic membrane protein A
MPNVFAYEARSEQGGYVNGVVAASLSESGVIGVIGPIETGDAKLYVDGFTAGVAATNPEATVATVWTGSFSDTALASQAAQTHIDAGADVLTGTAQMVTGAIGVAQESDVLWFGTQSNQTVLAPGIVVASQVYHFEVVLEQIIALIQEGTYGGQAFAIDLAGGGEVVEFNPDYAVPADVMTLADDTIASIADGSLVVPLPYRSPHRLVRGGACGPAPNERRPPCPTPPALRSAASSCVESSSVFRAWSPTTMSA